MRCGKRIASGLGSKVINWSSKLYHLIAFYPRLTAPFCLMKKTCYAVALIAIALLPSCKRVGERVEITETREMSAYARKPVLDASSATRFFDDAKDESDGQPRQHPLLWTTPEGWQENAPSQMRLIDFKFGPKQEGECYLSAMPGPAGGLAANINRWRGQVGQPALTDEEIAKLPRKTLLGAEAHFVSVDGDFKGVGAESAQTDYRLLGVIQQAPELTIFVKMTGPKEIVEKNAAAFDAFCGSVKFRAKEQKVPMH